jgi:hypothetical protein
VVEAHSPGRLSPGALRWWFTRVRGLEFEVVDALETVQRLTSGIPLLVGVFDRLLLGWERRGGVNVTPERFRKALEEFDREARHEAGELVNGPPALRLEPRERAVLRMLVAVARANGFANEDPREHLLYGWELYQHDCPEPGLSESGGDVRALAVVQALGLVPVRGERPIQRPFERLAPLPADDALLTLVEAWKAS